NPTVAGVRGHLTTLAYRGATRVAQLVPGPLAPALGRLAGRIGGWPQRDNRRMSARHQARVKGDANGVDVDAVFESYGRYWLEIFRLPTQVRRGDALPDLRSDRSEHIPR